MLASASDDGDIRIWIPENLAIQIGKKGIIILIIKKFIFHNFH
jgi:hypothetical protein